MLIHSPTISVSLSIPSPCLVDTLNHTVIHIRSIIIQQHIPTQFVTPFLSPIPIPRPCHLDLMLVSCFRLVLLVRLVFLLHSITVSATPSHGSSGLHHRCACASHILIQFLADNSIPVITCIRAHMLIHSSIHLRIHILVLSWLLP